MPTTIKVAVDIDKELYEKFRRIYTGHGDVSRFFRVVMTRVVNHVQTYGEKHLSLTVEETVKNIVEDDIDKGRAGL